MRVDFINRCKVLRLRSFASEVLAGRVLLEMCKDTSPQKKTKSGRISHLSSVRLSFLFHDFSQFIIVVVLKDLVIRSGHHWWIALILSHEQI